MATQKQSIQLVKKTAFTFKLVSGQHNNAGETTTIPTTTTLSIIPTCICTTGLKG